MHFKCKYGLIVKTFLFQAIRFCQTIQFSISMLLVQFNPYQVQPRRAKMELGAMARGTPHSQSSCITVTSPSDCLMSYQDTRWGGSYPSAEVLSVYSTAPAN